MYISLLLNWVTVYCHPAFMIYVLFLSLFFLVLAVRSTLLMHACTLSVPLCLLRKLVYVFGVNDKMCVCLYVQVCVFVCVWLHGSMYA